MKAIRSKLNLYEYEYEKIAMLADSLIKKIVNNKLKKADRELLESAVALIYELRRNEF